MTEGENHDIGGKGRRDCPIFLFSVDPFFLLCRRRLSLSSSLTPSPFLFFSLLSPRRLFPIVVCARRRQHSFISLSSAHLFSTPSLLSSYTQLHYCNHSSEEPIDTQCQQTQRQGSPPVRPLSLSRHPFNRLLTPSASPSSLFSPSTSPLITLLPLHTFQLGLSLTFRHSLSSTHSSTHKTLQHTKEPSDAINTTPRSLLNCCDCFCNELDTAFKQQRLKAWQPILTPKTVLPTFILVGILFAPIGGLLLWASDTVSSHTHHTLLLLHCLPA